MVDEVTNGASETEEPVKLVIDDVEYDLEDLSDEVKELLSLHQQALQMAVGAKRQAAIHDLSVASLSEMITTKIKESESDIAEGEIIEEESAGVA